MRTIGEVVTAMMMGLALLIVPAGVVIFGDSIKAMIPGTSSSCPAGAPRLRVHDVGAAPASVAAVAEQPQQGDEQVDEVEVQRERAGDRERGG